MCVTTGVWVRAGQPALHEPSCWSRTAAGSLTHCREPLSAAPTPAVTSLEVTASNIQPGPGRLRPEPYTWELRGNQDCGLRAVHQGGSRDAGEYQKLKELVEGTLPLEKFLSILNNR